VKSRNTEELETVNSGGWGFATVASICPTELRQLADEARCSGVFPTVYDRPFADITPRLPATQHQQSG
jgi:hypothetical protein